MEAGDDPDELLAEMDDDIDALAAILDDDDAEAAAGGAIEGLGPDFDAVAGILEAAPPAAPKGYKRRSAATAENAR